MSKNVETAVRAGRPVGMTTRTMAHCALLAALGVVMARLFGLMPNEFSRFSIEAVPTVIAGILFGPLAGGLVGFTADLVGCMFSGYGYNPLFCVPPILYGVCGGLFRPMLAKKLDFWRVLLTVLPAAALGSVLWQSFALTYVYANDGAFWVNLAARLGARGIQFLITMVVDAVIIYLLFQAKIFQHMKVWPPQKTKRND